MTNTEHLFFAYQSSKKLFDLQFLIDNFVV